MGKTRKVLAALAVAAGVTAGSVLAAPAQAAEGHWECGPQASYGGWNVGWKCTWVEDEPELGLYTPDRSIFRVAR